MNKIILVLIIVNVLISIKGFQDISFFNRYKFQIDKILKGDYYRMISSAFLHADGFHLGFNMYGLWLFGSIAISSLSIGKFLLVYLFSLFLGSLYSLQIHKKNSFYSAIGASGAVIGVMYLSILLYPNKEYSFMFFPFFGFPGWVLGLCYLLYSIYGMKNRVGNVGHSAHIGGAIGGYVTTLILKPTILKDSPLIIGGLGLVILVLLFFGKQLKLRE